MNGKELAELISDCPIVYHMAEDGSWSSIRIQGLLSTTALLDRYGVSGDARKQIEEARREKSIRIEAPNLPPAVIRDQLPMDDVGLRRALPAEISPAGWYKLLNSKVFFWFSRERLMTLMSARAYRGKRQDVLEVDSAALIDAYAARIWLCPMNSGCTKPFPHPRSPATFSRICDYPYSQWRGKRPKGERVVELAIDYEVSDIRKYVRRVVSMESGAIVGEIFVA